MDLTLKAREVFATDRYATEVTGIVIEHVDNHSAECSLTVDRRHCNARNMVMGGVLFTLADFCAAVAANSTTLDNLCWVSLGSNIHFLAAAGSGTLEARSIAIKAGRSTSLYQTKITSLDNGKTIAVAETTMIHV